MFLPGWIEIYAACVNPNVSKALACSQSAAKLKLAKAFLASRVSSGLHILQSNLVLFPSMRKDGIWWGLPREALDFHARGIQETHVDSFCLQCRGSVQLRIAREVLLFCRISRDLWCWCPANWRRRNANFIGQAGDALKIPRPQTIKTSKRIPL